MTMTNNRPRRIDPFNSSRRRFVQGASFGVLALGATKTLSQAPDTAEHQTLSGTQFDLEVGAQAANFTGQRRVATAVNGQLPGPLLRCREGDRITLRVTNHLPAPRSLHSHRIFL